MSDNHLGGDPSLIVACTTITRGLYREIFGCFVPGAITVCFFIALPTLTYYVLASARQFEHAAAMVHSLLSGGGSSLGYVVGTLFVTFSYAIGSILYRRALENVDAVASLRQWANTDPKRRDGLTVQFNALEKKVKADALNDNERLLAEYEKALMTPHKQGFIKRCWVGIRMNWPLFSSRGEKILAYCGEQIKYPYPYLQKYLSKRNFKGLVKFVGWGSGLSAAQGVTDSCSRNFINILKYRIRHFGTNDMAVEMDRNECHIRMLNSLWYSFRFIRLAIMVCFGFIIAQIALDAYREIRSESQSFPLLDARFSDAWPVGELLRQEAWESVPSVDIECDGLDRFLDFLNRNRMQISVVIGLAALFWGLTYCRRNIEKTFHYVREREIVFILEAAEILDRADSSLFEDIVAAAQANDKDDESFGQREVAQEEVRNTERYSHGNGKLKVVLLFEGSENDPLKNPSAISRLSEMLVDDVYRGQAVHLMSGTGTHGFSRLFKKICSLTGWDSGWIVRQQLWWLKKLMVDNDLCWDDIDLYVFGFSRGAYQARLFANKVERTNRRRQALPKVQYLGLIDAVKSVLLFSVQSHEEVLGNIECRHAVAIHEYRKKFRPMLLNETKPMKNVEERFFMGAHSDIGWAYNGKRHERVYPLGRMFKCCSYHVNHAKTKLFGKMALSWLLDPVKSKIQFRENLTRDQQDCLDYEQASRPASDYVNTAGLFYLLLHDSLLEVSNACGLFAPCTRQVKVNADDFQSKLHYSAAAVGDILQSGLLGVQRVNLAAPPSRGCFLSNRIRYQVGEQVDQVDLLLKTFVFGKFDSRLRGLTLRHRHGIMAACKKASSGIAQLLRTKRYKVV